MFLLLLHTFATSAAFLEPDAKESLAWHQVQLLPSEGRLRRPGVLERCGWLGTELVVQLGLWKSWVSYGIPFHHHCYLCPKQVRRKKVLIRSEMDNL